MLRRLSVVVLLATCGLVITGAAHAGAGKPPENPSSLVATAISPTQINLSRVDNARDEDGFRIQRKLGAGGIYEDLDIVGPNSESYADITCSPSTTYRYRVCAFNQYGDSSWSPEAYATAPSGQVPPEAPSGLVATAVSPTQVDVTWVDNSALEDGFVIEVDEGNTGTFVYLDTLGPNVTSYPDGDRGDRSGHGYDRRRCLRYGLGEPT